MGVSKTPTRHISRECGNGTRWIRAERRGMATASPRPNPSSPTPIGDPKVAARRDKKRAGSAPPDWEWQPSSPTQPAIPDPHPSSPTPIGDLWGTVRGYPTTPSAPKNGNSKRISRDKERVNPECRIRGGGGTPPIGQPGPSRDANFRPVPVLNCRCPQSRAIIESQATGVMPPQHAARAVSSAG